MKAYLYNMVANLKNAQLVKKAFIVQQQKNMCEGLLNILWDEGFILGYKNFKSLNKLKIYLKYKNGNPVINSIKFVSKPSLRVYYSSKNLWKLESSIGLLILSTNQGLKTINECKKLKLGGEPIVIIK